EELAIPVEDHDRLLAAMEHEEVVGVVGGDGGDEAELNGVGQLAPARDRLGIGKAGSVVGRAEGGNGEGGNGQQCTCEDAHVVSSEASERDALAGASGSESCADVKFPYCRT